MPKIQLRRGLESKLPSLSEGEPGFTTDTGKLFIGSANGNVEVPNKEDISSINLSLTEKTRQLKDIVINVKDYGATGGSNDSAAFQSTNDALVALGGGTLYVPRGTWYANFTLDSKVRVVGDGVNISVIKSVAGSNKDVIKGRNFDTLTGKTTAALYSEGLKYVVIKDITIDGNKANNTSGYGIRLWGRYLLFENVLVQNCCNDGIWTEFSTHNDPMSSNEPSAEALESMFKNIKCLMNGNNGWTFAGPHDSNIDDFVAFGNTNYALKSQGSFCSLNGKNWNSWLNGNSFNFTQTARISYIIASGTTGIGVELSSSSGRCCFTNLICAGHPTGVILRGTTHTIQGEISDASSNALTLDGGGAHILDLQGGTSNNYFNIISENSVNTIRANLYVDNAKTLKTGNFSGSDTLQIAVYNNPAISIFQLPVRTGFKAGGWSPIFPQSNGTILTDDVAPTASLRGGVLQQTAMANLSSAPTATDFNNLLTKLRSAGIIAP